MTVALCFILASPLVVHGQDADCGPVTDVTIEQPGWVDRWLESTYRTIDDEFVGATRMMNTPPDGIPPNAWDPPHGNQPGMRRSGGR